MTVLNPALHSRIFYKAALTQANAGYKVTVIGQDVAQAPYEVQGVSIVPTGIFGRLSRARINARSRICRLALAEKADVYVIHTPELLAVGRRLKEMLPHARFIYDMHEDYHLNISTAGYYPVILRNLMAKRVRAVERAFARWGDAVIYAENCFEGLLDFPQGRAITALNKFVEPPGFEPGRANPVADLPVMLFSGTVAENWGIYRALELWEKLNAHYPLRFVVAGKAYSQSLQRNVLDRVAQNGLQGHFEWIGAGDYVAYPNILAAIERCTVGVAPYLLRPNIATRIPTRFYEYMALGKPLIFTENPPWDALNARHAFGRGLQWPLAEEQVRDLAGWIREKPALWHAPEAYAWAPEGEKVLDLLARIRG